MSTQRRRDIWWVRFVEITASVMLAGAIRVHSKHGEVLMAADKPDQGAAEADILALEAFVPESLRPYLEHPEVRKSFDERSVWIAFGQLVRTVREAQSMTQAEFADRLGISPDEVSNIESGWGPPVLTLPWLARLAQALDADLNVAFVAGEGTETVEHTLVLSASRPGSYSPSG